MWGEYVKHDHLSLKNIFNAFLFCVALTPSFCATGYLYTKCSAGEKVEGESALIAQALSFLTDTPKETISTCELTMNHPIAFANILFLINVTFGFWLVGVAQRSFWLIDPYWTLIPPLLGHLYRAHPLASYDSTRSAVTLGLLWIWSARLTHSYFRREDWKFGEREDWRYTKMAKENPRIWLVLSFFAVGLA